MIENAFFSFVLFVFFLDAGGKAKPVVTRGIRELCPPNFSFARPNFVVLRKIYFKPVFF